MAVTTAAAAIAMIPTVAISACRPLVIPMDGMANLTSFLPKQEHKVSYQYSQKRYILLPSVQGFKGLLRILKIPKDRFLEFLRILEFTYIP